MESYLIYSVMLRYKQMITGVDYIIASIITEAEPILRFPDHKSMHIPLASLKHKYNLSWSLM